MSPRILDLPNLGPTSEAPPETAGTTTIDHQRLGAVRASVEVDAAGCRSSLDVLWALEGALAGPYWRDGAREHRTGRLRALTYIRRDLKS